MKEIAFFVEESQDGGFLAKADDHAIFTQGDTLAELIPMISDAIRCHFDEAEMPSLIQLHGAFYGDT